MKTQEWNPGFVPESGYPYSEPASIKMLADKYRLHPRQSIDGRIMLNINEEAYPDIKMNEEKSETEDFLIFRLFEYSEALNIAEGQILDMLHEDPFIPESMNFDVAFKNSDIHEAPVKIYINKTDQNILLFRKPGSPMEEGYNPAMYTLQMKKDDGSILSVDLMLSSKRIAYVVLWSHGVPVKSTIEFNPEIVEEVKDDYRVTYNYSDRIAGGGIKREYLFKCSSEVEALDLARKELIKEYNETGSVELRALLFPGTSEERSLFATKEDPYNRRLLFIVTKLNGDSATKEAVTQIQNSKPIGITEEEIDDIAFTESVNNEKALDEEYLSSRPRPEGTIRVFFKRKHNRGTYRMVVDIVADNNQEALSKASFLLTSDEEYNFGAIEFNELSIVE